MGRYGRTGNGKGRDPRDKSRTVTRPKVTDANITAYTDKDKKRQKIYGVGAKLAPETSALGKDQRAAGKHEAKMHKAKTGQYPTATTSEVAAAKRSRTINESAFKNAQADKWYEKQEKFYGMR